MLSSSKLLAVILMLTTIERAKPMLRIATDDTSRDAELGMLIPAASAAVETYCNRQFGRGEHTEKFEGSRSDYILLRNYPVISVQSINGKTDLTDYDIDLELGMVRKEDWSNRRGGTVTYTAGYILPENATANVPADLPADIEFGCILMIQHLMRQPGVTAERVGDLAVSYAADDGKMPPAVRALISAHRNVNI
jgi:hypothetical protein